MSADWTTSSKERARRVSVAVKINGADISEDMGKYLLSLSYSDERTTFPLPSTTGRAYGCKAG